MVAAPVKKDKGPDKKKKKRGRVLKITNSHMKDYVSVDSPRCGPWLAAARFPAQPKPTDPKHPYRSLHSRYLTLTLQGIDFSQEYEAPS